jgi:hypothetical protein
MKKAIFCIDESVYSAKKVRNKKNTLTWKMPYIDRFVYLSHFWGGLVIVPQMGQVGCIKVKLVLIFQNNNLRFFIFDLADFIESIMRTAYRIVSIFNKTIYFKKF